MNAHHISWFWLFCCSLIFFSFLSFSLIQERIFSENLKLQVIHYQKLLNDLNEKKHNLLSNYSHPQIELSNLGLEFLTLPSYSLKK